MHPALPSFRGPRRECAQCPRSRRGHIVGRSLTAPIPFFSMDVPFSPLFLPLTPSSSFFLSCSSLAQFDRQTKLRLLLAVFPVHVNDLWQILLPFPTPFYLPRGVLPSRHGPGVYKPLIYGTLTSQRES